MIDVAQLPPRPAVLALERRELPLFKMQSPGWACLLCETERGLLLGCRKSVYAKQSHRSNDNARVHALLFQFERFIDLHPRRLRERRGDAGRRGELGADNGSACRTKSRTSFPRDGEEGI